MAQVYPNANAVAARHVDTRKGVKRYRDGMTVRAEGNLAAANKTTRITPKDYFPAQIESVDGDADAYTVLHAPNAMALEFGHDPSGFFAGTDTKAPDGEYILTRASLGGSI